MKTTVLTLGDNDFTFNVSNAEYNKFLNSTNGGRAVQAGFNLLTATVEQKQRAAMIELLTDDQKQPHGTLVLEAVAMITEELTDALPELAKKRVSTPTSAEETA